MPVISLGCLHDTFNLRCPVCGNPFWGREAGHVQCKDCGVEVTITENEKQCRVTREVHGA
jgi:uncharacterized Zn finger protein (UPF0148 family)